MICKYFLPFSGLSFFLLFLIVSLDAHKFLILVKSDLFFLLLSVLFLVNHSKFEAFLLCFFLRVLCLTFVTLIQFESSVR